MISDADRREMAATMRAISVSGLRNLTLGEMLNSILTRGAPRPTTEMAILASLADLIDHPTCRNVYDEVYDEYEGGCCENGFKCSKCGELVEDCEGYRVKGTFNYCPNCGAEVVPDAERRD